MSAASESRTVHLDAEIVRDKMRRLGWTAEELARRAGISNGTVSNLLEQQKPVYWRTAAKFQKALRVERLDELLRQSDENAQPRVETIQEWIVDEVLTNWITASNQLQFHICRLKHQHLKRLARGKRYELRAMSSADQERCRALFLRHAEVCAAIGSHPHIIRNLTTYPAPGAWWVIEEWVEGETLRERMRAGQVLADQALRWLLQIADALHALHTAGIIRRELAPQSILIREERGDVVLTEFELAKLLDGSPTVASDDWPVDPYRAPEAESDDINVQADVYSWGRLATHLLVGKLPDRNKEAKALQQLKLPPSLEQLLIRCVTISRRGRPADLGSILETLRMVVAT